MRINQTFFITCFIISFILQGMINTSNLKNSFTSNPKETITFTNDLFIPEFHKSNHLDQISKIKKGLQIDSLFQYEPYHPEKSSSNFLRNLAESNTLSKSTGFIPMDADNQQHYGYVESYILKHLYQSQSSTLIYLHILP